MAAQQVVLSVILAFVLGYYRLLISRGNAVTGLKTQVEGNNNR